MPQERRHHRRGFSAVMSKKQNRSELDEQPPFDEMRSWALIGVVFVATGLGVWVPLAIGWH